jgi:hypothetical protein
MEQDGGQRPRPPRNQAPARPACEDHGRVVTGSRQAAAWYREAQRAPDGRRAIVALRLAVAEDPAFELAVADLDAITGTSTAGCGRAVMNWERHHIEVVSLAATGNAKRAADLLREHLAGIGCDPLAYQIALQQLSHGESTDDLNDLVNNRPGCHALTWRA